MEAFKTRLLAGCARIRLQPPVGDHAADAGGEEQARRRGADHARILRRLVLLLKTQRRPGARKGRLAAR